MNQSQTLQVEPTLSIIAKLKILINRIISIVNQLESDPSINYSAYPINVDPAGLSMMKGILIAPDEYVAPTLQQGYKRYKPDTSNDGHNGLKCLIYGILFLNGKFIKDTLINNIIKMLYASSDTGPILSSKENLSKPNITYASIETQPNTGKRHILDVLNTIMCLIDESFSYGYSYAGMQYGKAGSTMTTNGIIRTIDPNTDTLGYLIYIVAFYNIRWLTAEQIPQYKQEFAQALTKCDVPNANGIRCKDPSLARQIQGIDAIMAVQKIDSSTYI